MLAEGHPVPVLEVGQAGLVGELAGIVVDPVPRETACAFQRPVGGSVGMDGQRQGRPHQRGLPLNEWLAANAARRRDAGAPAADLHEGDRVLGLRGLALNVRQSHCLKGARQLADLDCGGAHQASAAVAGAGDASGVVDLHPGLKNIGKAEAVGFAQRFDVGNLVRRRLVVVREAGVEGDALAALDGLRGNPGQSGD